MLSKVQLSRYWSMLLAATLGRRQPDRKVWRAEGYDPGILVEAC